MEKKKLDWKLSADWLTLQKKEAVCEHFAALRCKDRFNQSAALQESRQPISNKEKAEWRAGLTEIPVQIFIRYIVV